MNDLTGSLDSATVNSNKSPKKETANGNREINTKEKYEEKKKMVKQVIELMSKKGFDNMGWAFSLMSPIIKKIFGNRQNNLMYHILSGSTPLEIEETLWDEKDELAEKVIKFFGKIARLEDDTFEEEIKEDSETDNYEMKKEEKIEGGNKVKEIMDKIIASLEGDEINIEEVKDEEVKNIFRKWQDYLEQINEFEEKRGEEGSDKNQQEVARLKKKAEEK